MQLDFSSGGCLLRVAGGPPRLLRLVDGATGGIFYYQPFDGQQPGVKMPFVEEPVERAAEIDFSAFYPAEVLSSSADRSIYMNHVARAKEWAAQHGGKVVLSRMVWKPGSVKDPVGLFHALCQAYPQATVHVFFHPQHGVWIGATPETLLKRDGHRLEAMSLAGTQQVGTHTIGAKEAHEQALVTRQLLHHFEALGVHNVETSGVEMVQAGPVEHLLTWVRGNWDGPLQKALDLLHPTPAVCGYPREQARTFLNEVEGYDRGFYAGYFGIETKDSAQLFVNLRCGCLYTTGLALFAGGGITGDSVPEDEWKETERKLNTLESVFKAYDPGLK